MNREPFIPPLFIMPMPLNEFGEGPETDFQKIVELKWEIWDQLNRTVSCHDTKEEAEKHLEIIGINNG